MRSIMKSQKIHFIIVSLSIVFVFFHNTAYAAEPTASDKYPAAQVIHNTIYTIKSVLIRQLASKDIEEMIKLTRDSGGTSIKLNNYSGGRMGWSAEDSKGREVLCVIFSFHGRLSKLGTYFSPLMSFHDAIKNHSFHREVLSGYFNQLGTDKYDINDNCTAVMELFKGSSGLGRTRISVRCH